MASSVAFDGDVARSSMSSSGRKISCMLSAGAVRTCITCEFARDRGVCERACARRHSRGSRGRRWGGCKLAWPRRSSERKRIARFFASKDAAAGTPSCLVWAEACFTPGL
eukprot:5497817-Prymnesium_polylepis.2